MSWFDTAFEIVVGIEGGYVNDVRDPGGETKFGISKRQYPREDIPNLSLERAKAIYLRDYWDAHGCGDMPWCEALLVFDTAVNGGNADRWHSMFSGAPEFIELYQAEHNLYLAALHTWPAFGRGWSRRLIKVALAASRQPPP
jgi:lysozyme family protein